jgi:hypothetical protein
LYISHVVKEMFPPTQDILGIRKQTTILIHYSINSKLVPFLKFIYTSVQIPNSFVFVISFNFINFAFKIFLFLFLTVLRKSNSCL